MSTTAHGTSTAPRLRLTRRGRFVFGTLLAAPIAVVLAVAAFGTPAAQAGDRVPTGSFEYVTVAAGESLWELAEWLAPESDPREVISQISALNQISASDVHPGQRLAIPAIYAQ